MKIIRSEAWIREEIKRLDQKTGLNGNSLGIRFNNAQCTLGQYDGGPNKCFIFSNFYYQNPDWPDKLAIDVIRHEYAHYMDHMLYGNRGHGPTWKACCTRVGIAATRLYFPKEEQFCHHKEQQEQALLEKLRGYAVGERIAHPRYGIGTITALCGENTNLNAVVSFASVGEKTLSLSWIADHCSKGDGSHQSA